MIITILATKTISPIYMINKLLVMTIKDSICFLKAKKMIQKNRTCNGKVILDYIENL